MTVDPRIVAARGFTADAHSIHVVTTCPVTRGPARVASFSGSDTPRALGKMATYVQQTGRAAWLVRGMSAAFLPFPEAARTELLEVTR